ncbi:MAG: helix-turn-helix domain-containing protein [Sporichthyaceae bacterium]
METIKTSNITAQQLDAVEQFATNSDAIGPELRDVLLSVSRCVREGADLAVVDSAAALTPQQAASRLGMSRTHLYKLLDQGEIVFHHVGRDRRIAVRDLVAFEAQRQRDRRELAERFAHHDAGRARAIDEIADSL